MVTALILIALAQEQEKPLPERLDEEPAHLSSGVSIDAWAAWTGFDNDLRIEDGPGFGLEAGIFSWNHGGPVTLRVGAFAWETETEEDEIQPADVRVRQYLLGVGAAFQEELLELGFRFDLGAFTWSSRHDRDAAGFFRFGLDFGVCAGRHAKAGLLLAAAFTHSDFNRGSEHVVVLPTAALGLTIRF